MNKIKTVIILFCFSMSIIAQIPNAGFENWIDNFTPNNWVTNNLPSSWNTVIRSDDNYKGSSAVKLEVVEFFSLPISPTLNTTFSVDQFYGSINGYYKLHKVNNEGMLFIYAYYYANDMLVASDGLELDVASSTYLPFSLEFNPPSNTNLDSIWIQFQVIGSGDNDFGIGTYALIDELSLGQVTDIVQIDNIPSEYSLKQNYPNPFNPTTTISYSIPSISRDSNLQQFINLTIYDLLGREVKKLVNEFKQPGNYQVTFDASSITSGIYYYTLTSSNFTQTKKMLLIK